ncbi:MAG: VOC family protein [Planctomycetia bacterium]|nr:VOC family protein [Planctomycetia bacterium]
MANPVVHFEIGCRDSARTQQFFKDLFGWTIAEMGPAAMIDTGSKDGIQGHITALGHEPFNYVTVYVMVDDLTAYLEKAAALGGQTLIPPTEVPGMGHFAWFKDVDGNCLGLWKPLVPPAPPPAPEPPPAAAAPKAKRATRKPKRAAKAKKARPKAKARKKAPAKKKAGRRKRR